MIRLHPVFAAAVLAAGVSCLMPAVAGAASFPPVRGSGGAVSSDEAAATAAGLEILAAGGNAADAAVATALALAVVHPEAGNLGGGGFAVLRFGETVTSLDFRETAPAAAHRALYLDARGEPIPDASLVGPLAAGVPGSPAGLFALHERFGRLPWAAVVAPAVRLAEEGFPLSQRTAATLESNREKFARFPETAAVWLPGGSPPEAGSRLRLPELAATLRLYAAQGPAGITTGPVAEAILEASRRHGGILDAADLAGYRAVWREPVHFSAFGWEFASMDLPSSGGIILGQTLQQLETLDWPALPSRGAARHHMLAEVLRRSFLDRGELGDPERSPLRAAELLAADHLAAQRASFRPGRATPSASLAAPRNGREASSTTHLSVIDAEGGAVALTTTLNGLYGCKLYVPGAGFFLNNEMDDFTTAPGRPNQFGLLQGAANEVAPGRRMLSAMSPTLAWRGGELLALGGRGGPRIPTAVLQSFLALAIDGEDLQAALARPRFHHQAWPDRLEYEADALSPETAAALEARGHELAVQREQARVNAVRRTPEGGFEAAGDPRGPGVGGVVRPLP